MASPVAAAGRRITPAGRTSVRSLLPDRGWRKRPLPLHGAGRKKDAACIRLGIKISDVCPGPGLIFLEIFFIQANGDGAGLRVSDTPIGKIGMLICGENTNPLARYSLIAYLADRFERAAIFLIRGDTAIGWKGVLHREPLPEIADTRIPLGEPSVLKAVVDGSGLYLGPLADTPMNMKILEGMGGGRPKTVLLAPLMISGRIVTILYADGEIILDKSVPELQKLLTKTALAFEALICREKILMI